MNLPTLYGDVLSNVYQGISKHDVQSIIGEYIGDSVMSDLDEAVVYIHKPEDPYVEGRLFHVPPSSRINVPGLEKPEHAPPLPDNVPGPELYDSDDEEGSSEDDEDDDMDIEADDDEEEEEHLAPTDSVVVALPATNQSPSVEETKPFKTDDAPPATTTTIPLAYLVTLDFYSAPVPTPVCSDAEVSKTTAISTPPSSPLFPYGLTLPHIPPLQSQPLSPTLTVLSLATTLRSQTYSVGYRAAMIWMRDKAVSTSHSLPLPPPFILSPTTPDAPSLGIPPPLLISVHTLSPPCYYPLLLVQGRTDPS
ncbi:hypothetical protein Tco_0456520 [Tanacetum coccineum]